MKKIIYLTGFMGSGKSTIGPILANTLGWDFYDLDKVIEENAGEKITEIFQKHGEEYFRKTETEQLANLSKGDKLIISLGGGTITVDKNLELMKSAGKIIYLKISPEAAYERLRFKRDRPILTRDGTVNLGREEFINKLQSLIDSREKFYLQADIHIDTDNVPLGRTIDKLAKIITREP